MVGNAKSTFLLDVFGSFSNSYAIEDCYAHETKLMADLLTYNDDIGPNQRPIDVSECPIQIRRQGSNK